MKKFFNEFRGVWILFFYYIKIPIAIGLPCLYIFTDYKNNYILDTVWLYCIYLLVEDIVNLIKNRGIKKV